MQPKIFTSIAVFSLALLCTSLHLGHNGISFDWSRFAFAVADEQTLHLQASTAAESARARAEEMFGSNEAVSNKELAPPEGIKLIVFSPHPDDESLAASGLIQRVLKNGGRVRVVFMTNGDGYREGVARTLNKTETSSGDFIEYGKRRQDEAIQALCQLGVPQEDIVFLGFPDDGIDDLWTDNWSNLKPFTSPFTRFASPPYKRCFSQMVKYSGSDLEGEVARIINNFSPDWVVMPDPRDMHPDHYTTGVFVLDALRRLNQEGEEAVGAVKIFTYLVHYMDYPTSREWAKEINKSGVGGTSFMRSLLSQTQWMNLRLTPEEMEGKRCALEAHQSQYTVLGYFLKKFLQPQSELFGRLETAQALAIPHVYAVALKRSSS